MTKGQPYCHILFKDDDSRAVPQPQSSHYSLGAVALLVSARIRARTAGGIPASRTAHERTPGHFLLRRIAHWATVSLAPLLSHLRSALDEEQ